MKIVRIISQHRRDFTAHYACEHCGHECTSSGYDDANFHDNVIPNWRCEKCGKTAPDDYRGLRPRYAPTDTV